MGVAFLLAAVAVAALVSPAAALEVPPLTGRIVDNAHLLPADRAASLSAELAAHEARTGNQVALLTLPSLEGQPLEEFSHRVATTWKLGQKGTDNGVLILVVPGERKVRIEVGYGLEGTLTDLKSSRIIREEMVPRFRTGDFPGGISAGVKAVLDTIEGTYQPPQRARVPQSQGFESAWGIFFIAVVVGILAAAIIGSHGTGKGSFIGGVMAFMLALSSGLILAIIAAILVLLITLILSAMASGRGRSSYGGIGGWAGGGFGGLGGGGGFGGGGFSGGGGSFGGGGASGGW